MKHAFIHMTTFCDSSNDMCSNSGPELAHAAQPRRSFQRMVIVMQALCVIPVVCVICYFSTH